MPTKSTNIISQEQLTEMLDHLCAPTEDVVKESFNLPSQFESAPNSQEHYRLKTDLIFEYYRNDTLLAQIDFSDIAIGEDTISVAGEDAILLQIHRDACLIADTQCEGKLQIGDVEVINGTPNRTLTLQDINTIAELHAQNANRLSMLAPEFTNTKEVE